MIILQANIVINFEHEWVEKFIQLIEHQDLLNRFYGQLITIKILRVFGWKIPSKMLKTGGILMEKLKTLINQ